MTQKRPLPPIIENWINSLNDPKQNIHIRDNYREMLENVRDQSTEAIQKYNQQKYVNESVKRKRA